MLHAVPYHSKFVNIPTNQVCVPFEVYCADVQFHRVIVGLLCNKSWDLSNHYIQYIIIENSIHADIFDNKAELKCHHPSKLKRNQYDSRNFLKTLSHIVQEKNLIASPTRTPRQYSGACRRTTQSRTTRTTSLVDDSNLDSNFINPFGSADGQNFS